jgi:Family of unknown function (DUF6263)
VLHRRIVLALVAAAGLAVPAFGQAPVALKWEFKKDVPFYQEISTITKQTMKVMGMDVSQNQSQTFYFSWTPVGEDKNHNWTIKQKIEAVKMEIEIAGNKIQYDSTKDTGQTGNPLSDFFKALVGSEFTLTISPEMKVTEIKGRDDFINKLVKANPQMEPLLKTILSDEALKQMSDSAFAALPNKPVKPGESWPGKSILDMGPIGKYDSTYKYTYEGKGKEANSKLDVIKVESTLAYQPPGPNASGALPFKIKKAELQSKDAKGMIYFDNEKHRLDHSEMHLTLTGKLTIDISGMPSDVDLNQVQDTTVKSYDKNPVEKK